jgi:hypothetical protein
MVVRLCIHSGLSGHTSSRRVPVAQVTADSATGNSGHTDARVYLVTVGGGRNRRARRISFSETNNG